jgi:hypothetical protein
MGVKVSVENFGTDDELVVNGQTLSGPGDLPPEESEPAPEYNHFGDFQDGVFGASLTFRDGLRTVYGSGKTLDVEAGDRFKLQVPSGEDLATRTYRLENGSNTSTLGKVRVKDSGGNTIADGTLSQAGSMTIIEDLADYEGDYVTIIFRDGGFADKLGYSCYNDDNG